MTSGSGEGGGEGGGGKPPGPPAADGQTDPLMQPASDAGWGESPPAAPRSGPSFPAYVPPAPPATPPTVPIDEPLLPTTFHENDLRSAVGATPLADASTAKTRKRHSTADDDDDDGPPRAFRHRRTIAISALSVVGGLAIAGLALLGRVNSDRYLLACEAERAVPQQGRGFPPWGMRALEGDAWKPLKIAPETRCQPRETEDVRELERLYLAMILDQATALLTAREVTRLDEADALLKQALLLTRPPEREDAKAATERNERRQDIERLLGDVTYWRATARLRDATAALGEAAKQFDAAAEQHPRHMSDAPAWAIHVRKLVQQLTAGPSAAAQPPAGTSAAAPTPDHPAAPVGTALPVEPGAGSAAEAPVAPAPDAGVPAGGVLL